MTWSPIPLRRPAGRILWTAGALLLAAIAARFAGAWLVVSDPLQPARAVVVLGGQMPFRAMEATAVYKQGWTTEVWITPGRATVEDEALARLGIDKPSESAYSRLVLERLGVPHDAIRSLAGSNRNTADEVRSIARELRATDSHRVILVTSKYHGRRVKMLWRVLVGSEPEAILRYTPEDPFEPNRWWRTSEDAMAVSREWFGIFNALAGFPVRSER